MTYSPNLGRWLQQDPIDFEAGDSNLYRYIGNNPTTFLDPSGLQTSPNYQTMPGPGDALRFGPEFNLAHRCESKVKVGDCTLTQNVEIRGRAWRMFPDGKSNDSGDHYVQVQLRFRYTNRVLSCPCKPDEKLPDHEYFSNFELKYGIFIRGVEPPLDGFASQFKPSSCEAFESEFIKGATSLTPKPKPQK